MLVEVLKFFFYCVLLFSEVSQQHLFVLILNMFNLLLTDHRTLLVTGKNWVTLMLPCH